MKPSGQFSKCGSSNAKSKKNLKDRDKRKPQSTVPEVNHNSIEKGSPTKETSTRLYAGVDADSLSIYAEQTGIEHLTDEITNTLTEDINYRLRYIINDSLLKARLSGRNAISSQDIDQTFENLKIDKVFGAPSHPNWVPFGYQNLYYLDDKQVNLVEIARVENMYYQYSDAVITQSWLPEQKECSKALKNYYTMMCQMLVSNDMDTRRLVLRNIAENPRIGTIVEWFYNFGYILLSKDITYDCLTLRALDLITVLENSQMCRVSVTEKQLKLLVRLILQRLLKSVTTQEILKPMCDVLAILCKRTPLKEFVILKVQQKLNEVFDNYDLAVITIVNCLGIEGVENVFLPNLDLFIDRAIDKKQSPFTYSIMESFYILYKENLVDTFIYNTYFTHFGESLLVFAPRSSNVMKNLNKKEINFAHIKRELLKTRRKVDPRPPKAQIPMKDIFDMPSEESELTKKVNSVSWDQSVKQTSVTIGRTSLLLPVFQRKTSRCQTRCYNHGLWYNF